MVAITEVLFRPAHRRDKDARNIIGHVVRDLGRERLVRRGPLSMELIGSRAEIERAVGRYLIGHTTSMFTLSYSEREEDLPSTALERAQHEADEYSARLGDVTIERDTLIEKVLAVETDLADARQLYDFSEGTVKNLRREVDEALALLVTYQEKAQTLEMDVTTARQGMVPAALMVETQKAYDALLEALDRAGVNIHVAADTGLRVVSSKSLDEVLTARASAEPDPRLGAEIDVLLGTARTVYERLQALEAIETQKKSQEPDQQRMDDLRRILKLHHEDFPKPHVPYDPQQLDPLHQLFHDVEGAGKLRSQLVAEESRANQLQARLQRSRDDYNAVKGQHDTLKDKYQDVQAEGRKLRQELQEIQDSSQRQTVEVEQLRQQHQAAAKQLGAKDEYVSRLARLLLGFNDVLTPDPQAECLDSHLGYLLGVSKEAISDALSDVPVVKKLPGQGDHSVRSFKDVEGRLPSLISHFGLGSQRKEAGEYEREIQRISQRARSYFAGALDEEWSPELWTDDTYVHTGQVSLAFRRTESAITYALSASKVDHHDVAVGKAAKFRFFRWGDIRKTMESLPDTYSLRRPQRGCIDHSMVLELEKRSAEAEELRQRLQAVDGRSLTDRLIDVFRDIYAPQLQAAVSEYNRIFPDGVSESVSSALMNELGYIFAHVEGGQRTFAAIDQELGRPEVTLEEIEARLQATQIEFSQTAYAQAHLNNYELASVGKSVFMSKTSLTPLEARAKAIVEEWEDQRQDHYTRKKDAAALSKSINDLREQWQQVQGVTADVRRNLPLKATFASYALSIQRDDGKDDEYRLRFLIPSTEQTIHESATLTFVSDLMASLRPRVQSGHSRVEGGQIRGCHHIDLVYPYDVSDRVGKIIDRTRKDLQKGELARLGATIELQYLNMGDQR